MSDYKRIVSYIYDYLNGEKKNNVGFARVESRNGQCKISIHIKAPSMNNSIIQGYLFRRNNEKIVPILLGSVTFKNGTADFRMITNSNNIVNENITLEQIAGIIVVDTLEKFFGTEWDDIPIELDSSFLRQEEIAPTQSNADTNVVEKIIPTKVNTNIDASEEIIKKEYDTKKEYNTKIEHKTNDTIAAAQIQERNLEEEKIVKFQKPKTVAEEYLDKEYLDKEDFTYEQSDEYVKSNNDQVSAQAMKIFSRYTSMKPFDDDEVLECVRIEPQDIGIFPIENWILGNNSFLLHGYYNYKHLIFARKKKENGFEYIIGVPGVYHNREKFMARMFGFDQFKCMHENEKKTGELGYWYMPVKI